MPKSSQTGMDSEREEISWRGEGKWEFGGGGGWNKQFDMGIDGDEGERDDGNPNLSPRANGDTMQCE